MIDLNDVDVIASGLDHPESLVVLSSGDIVAGGEAGQIYLIRDGTVDVVAHTDGFILGLTVDTHDRVLIADRDNARLWQWSAADGLAAVSDGPTDRPFTNPNAIALSPFGAFVTNSGTWAGADGFVALIRADRTAVVASTDVARFPNGVALSPDGEWLYVIESNFGVVRCRVLDDGLLGGPESVVAMADQVPDGVLFDGDGGVLITCYQPNSVFRLDPTGQLTELVTDRQAMVLSMPTNGCWLPDGRLGLANLGGWHLAAVTTGLRPGPGPRFAFPVT